MSTRATGLPKSSVVMPEIAPPTCAPETRLAHKSAHTMTAANGARAALSRMSCILVVLSANVFADLIAHQQRRSHLEAPRFGICTRIVDRGLDLQMPQVWPPDALYHVELFRTRVRNRGPAFVVHSGGVHYQRVAFPSADGMSHPRGIGIRG